MKAKSEFLSVNVEKRDPAEYSNWTVKPWSTSHESKKGPNPLTNRGKTIQHAPVNDQNKGDFNRDSVGGLEYQMETILQGMEYLSNEENLKNTKTKISPKGSTRR